jgi:hypothetical protein
MGLLMNEVSFNGQAPSLNCIVNKITEISGLEISIEDDRDSYCNLNVRLSFSNTPDNQLKISTTVSVIALDTHSHSTSYIPRSSASEENESIDSQTVCLRMYVGQEATLLYIATIALEELGGRSRYLVSEEMRQQYSTRITSSELERRYQLNGVAIIRFYIILLVSLPLLIPYWMVKGIIFYIRLEDLRNNPDKYLED